MGVCILSKGFVFICESAFYIWAPASLLRDPADLRFTHQAGEPITATFLLNVDVTSGTLHGFSALQHFLETEKRYHIQYTQQVAYSELELMIIPLFSIFSDFLSLSVTKKMDDYINTLGWSWRM